MDHALNKYPTRVALAFPIPVVQRDPFAACRRNNRQRQQENTKSNTNNNNKNQLQQQQNSQEFATKKAKPIIDFQKVDDAETDLSNSLDCSTESQNMNPLPKKDKNRRYK